MMKKITKGRVKYYKDRILLVVNKKHNSAFKCTFNDYSGDIVWIKVKNIYSKGKDAIKSDSRSVLVPTDNIYLLEKSEEPEYRINELLLAIKI